MLIAFVEHYNVYREIQHQLAMCKQSIEKESASMNCFFYKGCHEVRWRGFILFLSKWFSPGCDRQLHASKASAWSWGGGTVSCETLSDHPEHSAHRWQEDDRIRRLSKEKRRQESEDAQRWRTQWEAKNISIITVYSHAFVFKLVVDFKHCI